jgi:hypothetical protein
MMKLIHSIDSIFIQEIRAQTYFLNPVRQKRRRRILRGLRPRRHAHLARVRGHAHLPRVRGRPGAARVRRCGRLRVAGLQHEWRENQARVSVRSERFCVMKSDARGKRLFSIGSRPRISVNSYLRTISTVIFVCWQFWFRFLLALNCGSGWPDWAIFRLLSDCLLWTVFWNL